MEVRYLRNMADTLVVIFISVIVVVGVLLYITLKPTQKGTKVQVPSSRGKPLIYNKKVIGGIAELTDVERITEDKSIFKFSNGITTQVHHRDIYPADVIQVLSSKERPLWVIEDGKDGDIRRKQYFSSTDKEKIANEKFKHEKGLNQYLLGNIQQEVDRRTSDIGKLEQAKRRKEESEQRNSQV